MKPRRKRLSRWLAGLPAVLVGSLWLLLAQAWPSRMPELPPQRSAPTARISYQRTPPVGQGAELMPLVFVQPPPKSGDLLAEESPDAVRLPGSSGESHLLERSSASESVPSASLPDLNGITNPAAFRLSAPEGKVFRAGRPLERGLVVEVSPVLRDRGFQLPALDAAELGNTNTAWQVALVVDGTQDGRVENVFLEAGTANVEFNRILVRRISLGATLTPGAPCRGRVVVSYGEE